MIALLYLAAAVFFGDALASRWFSSVTWLHRFATAFIVGLLCATWASYLVGLAFDTAGQSLWVADLAVGWAMVLAAIVLRRRPSIASGRRYRPLGWDRLVVAGFVALVGWMMLTTYSFVDGELRIAVGIWSDFGPTTAIAQNFALGDNFPTEYPHYAGEPIRYHFMYYFQVGNLTFLGLDPALANNLLSVTSMVSMLILVMALGERLFGSPWVGRIGAALFFFHGSLSFIPYLANLGPGRWLEEVPRLGSFLASGFPYRGEEWGIWSQIVFLNQRHLASAIGVLLIIVLFLLDRLPRGVLPADNGRALDEGEAPAAATPAAARRGRLAGISAGVSAGLDGARSTVRRPGHTIRTAVTRTLRDPALPGYLLCGFLAGLLPLYNGAMFIAAAAVLAAWLVLFPNRPSMILLAVAAAIPAIPQLLWVRPGTMAGEQTYPDLYWGYIVDDPTPFNVARYFAFVFGPKLLLVAVALIVGSWRQMRVFVIFAGLIGVAFLIQLSVEVLANHKFINTWLIVANLFAAYGLLRLWRARPILDFPNRYLAIALAGIIVIGGAIDLFPVKNQQIIGTRIENDRLTDWLVAETRPTDVFLSDIYVVHRILLSGRRLHYGWPYYAWSAGYAVTEREDWYRALFAERSPRVVAERLQAAGIDYVAIDDGLRGRGFAPRVNEEVFRDNFEAAFVDETRSYDNLTIYRVPAQGTAVSMPDAPAHEMYTGGVGTEPGQFDDARGIAVDDRGVVTVADSGNDRIQRFSSSGNPIGTIGESGSGPGQLDGPVGVALNRAGELYVADAGNSRVQQFDAEGAFVREWPGFTDLVDVDVDNDLVFALDAGTGQVTRIETDGTSTAWGGTGSGPGQLQAPTGLAVRSGLVVVADAGNARVSVWDVAGQHLRDIPVPEWQNIGTGRPDVALDGTGMVWLTSPATNTILVYRDDGTTVGTVGPPAPDVLDAPGAIARRSSGPLFVVNAGGQRVSQVLQTNP